MVGAYCANRNRLYPRAACYQSFGFFYAYDLLSPLVYLTGDGLKLVLASYQNNRQRYNFYPRYVKKYCKKTLTHRNIRGVAKICRVVEKSGRGFYLNKKGHVRTERRAIYNKNLDY